jgi:cytochrome P450
MSEPDIDFEDFDHREENHRVGAEALWARMRAAPGLPRGRRYGGFHVVTRYADVLNVALKHKIFSSASGISFPDLDFGSRLIPAEVDPPLHGEYRSLLTRFLTKERVEALEPSVRAMTRELLERIGTRECVDFVESFARPLPVMVSLELLGLPKSDAKFLDELIHQLHRERGTPAGAGAAGRLGSYLHDIVTTYESTAVDADADILSAMTLGTVSGRRLGMEEKLSMVRLLMFGGFDTTSIALASMMWWFAGHPDDLERMRADPSLVDRAVEEFVRFSSPASYLRRTVTEPTELSGCPLAAGDRVVISFAAANRDPAKFADPDVVVLDRSPNPHLGFGAGAHRCIGSHVAKLELRVALEEILQRYHSFTLDASRPLRWECGENQGICGLPLRLEPRAP